MDLPFDVVNFSEDVWLGVDTTKIRVNVLKEWKILCLTIHKKLLKNLLT